jgi:poly(3-hydroxybutyrate) depolymerase
MRMLILSAVAMVAAPLAAEPIKPAKFQKPVAKRTLENCPRATTYQAYDRGRVAKPRQLTELPGAHQFAAVYRTVNGCQVPLIVRYNVDG